MKIQYFFLKIVCNLQCGRTLLIHIISWIICSIKHSANWNSSTLASSEKQLLGKITCFRDNFSNFWNSQVIVRTYHHNVLKFEGVFFFIILNEMHLRVGWFSGEEDKSTQTQNICEYVKWASQPPPPGMIGFKKYA